MATDFCRYCGEKINTSIIKTDNTVHYGYLRCNKCNKFSHWVSNPNGEIRQTNRLVKLDVAEVCKYHNFSTEHCFFCLREKKDLGVHETLTVDHIEELDKGGKDEIPNMQVLCSACHKLKNWSRLYLYWHLKRSEDGDTKTTSM